MPLPPGWARGGAVPPEASRHPCCHQPAASLQSCESALQPRRGWRVLQAPSCCPLPPCAAALAAGEAAFGGRAGRRGATRHALPHEHGRRAHRPGPPGRSLPRWVLARAGPGGCTRRPSAPLGQHGMSGRVGRGGGGQGTGPTDARAAAQPSGQITAPPPRPAVLDCILASDLLAACAQHRPLKLFLIQLALGMAAQQVGRHALLLLGKCCGAAGRSEPPGLGACGPSAAAV